jgi:adenylate cyclase
MSLPGEIKRRKVFQVAAAYAVVAWVVIQIIDVIIEPLGLPDWLDTVVIILFAVGFPIALILAWFFDLTAEGIKRTLPWIANAPDSTTETAAGVIAGDAPRAAPELKVEALKASIAVLPFEAADQDQELAAGITTGIISELGGAAAISVASRHSVFAYKGRDVDPRDVGKNLGVSYVLEGNLLRAGVRLRIAVALTDTQHGHEVWTNSFDREIGNVLDLQEDISHAVGAAMGGIVRWAAAEGVQGVDPNTLDPAGLVHRALGTLFKLSRRTIAEGIGLIRQALEQEPDLAHGHALLSFFLMTDVISCWTDQPELTRRAALTAAKRAIELEPNDCWVLSFASPALMCFDEQQMAIKLMERALTLEPRNPHNLESFAFALINVGEAERALKMLDTAVELSPGDRLTPPLYMFRSYAYTQLGRFEEAEETGRKGIELMSGSPISWYVYINAVAETGKLQEAQHALTELLRLSPNLTLEYLESVHRTSFSSVEIAEFYLGGMRKLDWP